MSNEVQNAMWPLPEFSLSVQIGGHTASFQEARGLDADAFGIQAPDKGGAVTLLKGTFVNDATLRDWFKQITANTAQRQTVIVTLLDETGTPQMVWTLNGAWPAKVTGTSLSSEGNEVAAESIEVAYETLVISAP